MRSQLSPLNILLLVSLTIIWGTSYILMKKALRVFHPVEMAAIRISLSFIFTSPFLYSAIKNIAKKDIWKVAIVGLLGTGIPAFLFAFSMTKINSGVNGVINSLSPLFTVLSGYIFWKIETPKMKFLGVMIGLLGALFLILSKQHGSTESTYLFAILPVIATFCYGTNSNFVKQNFPDANALQITAIAMAIIGVPSLIYVLTAVPFSITTQPLFISSFSALIFLSLFGTIVAWMLFYKLVQRTDALFAASVTYLIPIVALSWGVLDGERFTPFHLVGLVLILIGVYFVSKK
jgi:drug/metabolite transporter (DMT)-like permease